MLEVHTIKEEERYFKERNKGKVICDCKHALYISSKLEFVICNLCGLKVYNKKTSFKNKVLKTMEKLKENTFTCKNCNEIVEEEHRAEDSLERFGEYDLCEWCSEEIKEDMR